MSVLQKYVNRTWNEYFEESEAWRFIFTRSSNSRNVSGRISMEPKIIVSEDFISHTNIKMRGGKIASNRGHPYMQFTFYGIP